MCQLEIGNVLLLRVGGCRWESFATEKINILGDETSLKILEGDEPSLRIFKGDETSLKLRAASHRQ